MSKMLLMGTFLALCSLLIVATPALAQAPVAITIQPDTTFQTMAGWEATAQAGQWEFLTLFPKYSNALLDLAVNDLGVNRLRVEIFAGAENSTDWFSKVLRGEITADDFVANYAYQIINDNTNPSSISSNGFWFSFIDHQMDTLAVPMKQRLEARGERLYLNVNYVDFRDPPAGSCSTCYEHYNYPDEYAELVLATYQHINNKYGFQPDAWEVILEPDNSAWGSSNGLRIGKSIYAAANRLRANGFRPAFIAPSVTNMNNLLSYIAGIKLGIKQQGGLTDAQVDQFIRDNMEEYSYHRYGTNDSVLATVAADAQAHGINTSQLEHIGADYNELHKDLKAGNNSAWQQYTLAYPGGDDGACYYTVSSQDPNHPIPSITSRTKFLRQYFKFIRPGAVRIQANSSDSRFDPVAFINASGKHVVVIKASSGGTFSIQGASGPPPGVPGSRRVFLPLIISNGEGSGETPGLPAGTYGIKYTTNSSYDVNLADVTIASGQALQASIPAAGVITVYRK